MPSHRSASSIPAPVRIRGSERVIATRWTRRIGSPLYALIATLTQEVRIRRDRRALMELGDHELADIGVCRDHIGLAVRTGRLSTYRMDHI
jgi:uncharacterized protein YjiS (DUF1127 family)